MATTIVTKYGSDAPADTDIVRGELAVDTENGRLYTENAAGAVVELGLKPEGALTADAGIDIDNINIDGTTIALSSGDLTLDVAGNLLLNADGGGIYFQDASLLVGSLQNSSSDLLISAEVADKDIIFRGIDDSTTIDALKLDMAAAGAATFNSSVTADGLTVEGNGTYLASLNNTAQDARIQLSREGTEFGQVSAGANLMNLVASGASTDMRFLTNSLERMRIDSSGRVSIGRSGNVTAKCLELQPPAQISDFLSYILNIGGDEADDAVGTKSGIGFGYTSTARPAAPATIGYETKNTGGGTYGDIYFATRATGGTEQPTERMRIDSSGNVGIGVAPTAAYKMQVNVATNTVSTGSPVDSSLVNIAGGTATVGDGVSLQLTNISGAKETGWRLSAVTTSGNNGDLVFNGYAGGADYPERMRITSSGLLEVQHDAFDGMQRSLTLSNPRNAAGSGDGTSIYFNNTGTSTIARSAYIGGVSEDNYGQSNALVFGVSSGGDAPTEAARIDSNKNLLVGNTDIINSRLGVRGTVLAATLETTSTNTGHEVIVLKKPNATGRSVAFIQGSSDVGNISVTSSATTYNTSSDQRLKDNIADADDAGSKIDAIQVRKFDWKADGSHQDYGMVAQELLEVAPEAVSAPEDPEEMMGVDYSKLVPMMLKEIQSLRARIAALES